MMSRHWMTMAAVAALSIVPACADDQGADEPDPPADSTDPVESSDLMRPTPAETEAEETEPPSTESVAATTETGSQRPEAVCEWMTVEQLNAAVDRARASSGIAVKFELFDESDTYCWHSDDESGFWNSPGWVLGADRPLTIGAILIGVKFSSAGVVDEESWDRLGYRADPLLDPSVHYQPDPIFFNFKGASNVRFNLWIGGLPIVRFGIAVGDAAGEQSDQDYESFALALANEMLIELGLIQAATAVAVSGTELCTTVAPVGDELDRYECVEDFDDERVSGDAIVTVTELERSVTPWEMTGTIEIENDGGRWVGDWTGSIESGGLHTVDGVLDGSGAYDGLRFTAQWKWVDWPGTVTGTIEHAQ